MKSLLPVMLVVQAIVIRVVPGSPTPQEEEAPHNLQNVDQGLDKICLTPGCVKAAAEVIKMMDTSKNPCDDFYDYACGNFVKETVIPSHQSNTGSFSIARDKLYERLKVLFEEPATDDNNPKAYGYVRQMYKSCMDVDSIEKDGLAEATAIIESLGGWPVILGDKWTEENFEWKTLAQKAHKAGFESKYILSVEISTNEKNSTQRIMKLDQPEFGLSREYLIKGSDDSDVMAYYKYMVKTVVYFGGEESEAKTEMKEVLEMEIKLANLALPKEERRNATAIFHPMNITEADKLWPGLNIADHINKILDNKEVTVNDKEIIDVSVPMYLTEASEYLKTVPKRVQANYLIWRYVKIMMKYLTKTALDIKLDYDKVIKGVVQQAPRWEDCVKSTSGNDDSYLYWYEGSLTNAVGAMYAKKYFDLSKKVVADDMVENIRKEFKIMLDELTWMDEVTKAKAHQKADSMTSWIGYAKEILDDQLLNEFYKELDISSDSYLANFLNLNKFIHAYYTKQLRLPKDKKSWTTHGGAAIVNAFYSPEENSIQFPAGILTGVFFQADRPLYMNYGAIGYVVGHEITHGFDDQGSQKDSEGNLVDWWEPDTKENYLEKAKCIIDQYSNYTVEVEGETLNVNGINTQGENIADNGGLKESLRAYIRIVEEKGEEKVLPGLNLSQRQLFWVSAANVWCSVRRPASLKNQVLTDPHSPSRFRVNVPLANNPEFARDFNCPKGSPMNPEDSCQVW